MSVCGNVLDLKLRDNNYNNSLHTNNVVDKNTDNIFVSKYKHIKCPLTCFITLHWFLQKKTVASYLMFSGKFNCASMAIISYVIYEKL